MIPIDMVQSAWEPNLALLNVTPEELLNLQLTRNAGNAGQSAPLSALASVDDFMTVESTETIDGMMGSNLNFDFAFQEAGNYQDNWDNPTSSNSTQDFGYNENVFSLEDLLSFENDHNPMANAPFKTKNDGNNALPKP